MSKVTDIIENTVHTNGSGLSNQTVYQDIEKYTEQDNDTIILTNDADFFDVTTTTADYTVGDYVADTTVGILYECILNSTAGIQLTNATYFTAISSNTLSLSSTVLHCVDGKDSKGYILSQETKTTTIDFTGVSDGLKWLALEKGTDISINPYSLTNGLRVYGKKPSIGTYEATSADDERLVVKDGNYYEASVDVPVNDDFSGDLSAWEANEDIASATIVSGELNVTNNANLYGGKAIALTGLTVGEEIRFTGDLIDVGGGLAGIVIVENITDDNGVAGNYSGSVISYDETFIATATTMYLKCAVYTDGITAKFDNIKVWKTKPKPAFETFDSSVGDWKTDNDAVVSIVGGKLRLTQNSVGTRGVYKAYKVTPNIEHTVEYDYDWNSNNGLISIGVSAYGAEFYNDNESGVGTAKIAFIPTTDIIYVTHRFNSGDVGVTADFDNTRVYGTESGLGQALTTPLSVITTPVMANGGIPQYKDTSVAPLPRNVMEGGLDIDKIHTNTINISDLPTTDPFIDGELWNNSNVITLSVGA